MTPLFRKMLIGIALGVVFYVGAVVYFDFAQVSEALAHYQWKYVGGALALSSGNYLLRYAKWELALKWLGIRAPGEGNAPNLSKARSFTIFLAGLSMSVTPGKVGEVLRSVLLRATDKINFSRTAPFVLADRLTDLLGLVLLSTTGVAGLMSIEQHAPYLVVALVLVLVGVWILGHPKRFSALLRIGSKIPKVGPIFEKAQGMVDSSAILLHWPRLLTFTVLSVLGWGLECVGFWLILQGFGLEHIGITTCCFLWSITTIIGALSFLPGGLLATEFSLGMLLTQVAPDITQATILAAVLLGRLTTLWYGELVGSAALGLLLRNPNTRSQTDEIPN